MQFAEDVIAGLFDSRHQWRRRRRRRCRPIWFRPKTPTPIRRHFNWKSPQRQIQSWRWTRLCERGGQPMPTPGLAIDAARRKSLSRPRGFYSAAKWRSRVSSRRPYFGGTRVGSELVIGRRYHLTAAKVPIYALVYSCPLSHVFGLRFMRAPAISSLDEITVACQASMSAAYAADQ